MNTNKSEFISLRDLGLAYRKAKVDAYYSSVLIRSEFVDYEKELVSNLRKFKRRLTRRPRTIPLGGWSLVPKKDDFRNDIKGVVHSSPQDRWEAMVRSSGRTKLKVQFRLMAQPSVDFHLLSALWMLKVGHLYDSKLGGSAYGNRMRRRQDGSVNPLSLGSFMPYLRPFREWRDNGIKTLQTALTAEKKVVAVTADVSGFYHELNPGFLLDDEFLDAIQLKPSDDERWLTKVFVEALESWAQSTPLKKGLPVGLPASGLVANMALVELDRAIERELVPLYYGRYVDDIMLAMEDASKFTIQEDVWEWIFKRVNGLLMWYDEDAKDAVAFAPGYLSSSRIVFSNEKNKVFLICGDSGKALIDSIADQVQQRASEWRALPDLPKDAKHVPTALVEATQIDGEAADNLRKADAISMRRAGFAIKLRDFEAYERDLSPDAWAEHRHAFLQAFIEHVLALPKFFDLADYLPRVVRIATACEDFVLLQKMLDRVFRLVDEVAGNCITSIKCCPKGQCPKKDVVIEKWTTQLEAMLSDSLLAAFPYRLSRNGAQAWRTHFTEDSELVTRLDIDPAPSNLKAHQRELFVHDLAHIPFRFKGLPRELSFSKNFPPKKDIPTLEIADRILPDVITSGLEHVARMMRVRRRKELPFGLLFATRPFNIQELYLLHPSPFAPKSIPGLSLAILALRGFGIEKSLPCVEKNGVLRIPLDQKSSKSRIAVASWETDRRSWTASVTKTVEPDTSRYSRLIRLLNEVLASPTPIDYLIMPELSVPPGWFIRIADKLRGKGISLISGVAYLHRPRRRVMNQVWAALSHDGLGFPSLAVYRQDKQCPALHEEKELFRVAGAVLRPQRTWRTPPVLRHGTFLFALLICSELTNIAYRSALRGRIDALFVPEWNRDTETFNALVESAALDIHAYIIQCNDRQYGDSRIRVPHKDPWKRDQVRIKGGKNDYFVVGEIEVASLRAFQSGHRSLEGPFKPVPDGFEISFERRALPQTKADDE